MCATPLAPSLPLHFRMLEALSSAERRFLMERELFDSARIEVMHRPGQTTFALIDEKAPGLWRWTVCCAEGEVHDEGWEPTKAQARYVAAEMHDLWFPGA